MSGLSFIHVVRERWPPIVLILASGRVSAPVADMPEDTVFFRKPNFEKDLLMVLEAVD